VDFVKEATADKLIDCTVVLVDEGMLVTRAELV